MSLSNLDNDTTTRLFKMIVSNENFSNEQLCKIKNDSSTYAQLNLINKQIESLKLEAINIIQNHVKTEEINNIICHFKKVPGTLYYLYSNNKNNKIISLVPPEYDTNGNIENAIYPTFLGNFFYDYDFKFKLVN
jgi:hypothetical protein